MKNGLAGPIKLHMMNLNYLEGLKGTANGTQKVESLADVGMSVARRKSLLYKQALQKKEKDPTEPTRVMLRRLKTSIAVRDEMSLL